MSVLHEWEHGGVRWRLRGDANDPHLTFEGIMGDPERDEVDAALHELARLARLEQERTREIEALRAALKLMVAVYPYTAPSPNWERQLDAHNAARTALDAERKGET